VPPQSCQVLPSSSPFLPGSSDLVIINPSLQQLLCRGREKPPDGDTYNLEILKDFAQEVGHGMSGIESEHKKPPSKKR
jgi:hypothetical protein